MLRRRLSLLQAVSVNMAMMVGMGPFVTIPLFVGAMGGPQAMIGWVLGALVAICDGMVWSELAAAFPGSGGTYHFFDAVYGSSRLGRLLKFLFVWQFLFSGPLELASGAIGFALYAGFLFPGLKEAAWGWGWPLPESAGVATWGQVLAVAMMLGVVGLTYRRIEAAGRLMVVFWAGMLVTVSWVILDGAFHFDPALAFDFPEGAWTLNSGFFLGLGGALGIAMYDFLGYYQICYLGDEVNEPARTIPRSILIAALAISLLYLTMNLGILGAMPWRDVVVSEYVASDLILRLHGIGWARVITVLILWTGAASTFSAMLGYSRIPYAAARSGHFFRGLARTHPTLDIPHRSLLLVGSLAALACLARLETVITALLSSRILIQFVVQIATVIHLRRRPELLARMPFRMWLYPLPAVIALVGWLWVFGTTPSLALQYGLLSLGLGLVVFVVWDAISRRAVISPEIDRSGEGGD